ncbi:alpha/beta fold hydrolase [Paenibacillus harenae]|uniref:alpha/beta fold hydrolase n=1 Tax=Paenibacillus harenae TaxID=306543 RepID=UPI00278E027E|nr:alpha/beta hydrolase [Paenibacillus harenae]MDQ0061720.1 pimeloyl-ACP methyl ester carboxylesterase [Paenibacillus harenae]
MQDHKAKQEKAAFVFIHGAGLDSRIWQEVTNGMDHPCLMVDYPHRGDTGEALKGLRFTDYVAHLRNQVDEQSYDRIVIVAHSLGGSLGLRLAAELSGKVAGFVAIGACIPKNGSSFVSALPFPKRLLLSAIMRILGTKPPESALRSGLCNDLSPEVADEIVRTFTPESVRVFTDRTGAPIPSVPKLFIKLTKDKEIDPALQQQMIANLSPHKVRSLETGHLPMLSDPEGLRQVLLDFLQDVK